MPSAHYQPLEAQAYEEEDDEGLHDADSQQSYHIRYHPQLGGEELPSMSMPSMAPRPNRSAAVRRRVCLLYLLMVAFFSGFLYFMFGPQTLGYGTGGDDASTDYEPRDALDSTNLHAVNESLRICTESQEDRRLYMQDKPRSAYIQLPVIYFVTPTYPRREQVPELTRLANTLLHVPRIHWLVANDHDLCDPFLDVLLSRFGIPYTHMASPMPRKFRARKPAPRGVANRRAALQWLHQHNLTKGILYFGDDDNTYDLRLFSEIRQTQRVSMFPVGLIADYSVSGPVVRDGKVVAFLDSWVAGRRWPVDMAGFAVNLSYMAQYPAVNMPFKTGYEEDLFLRSIGLHIDQIEPRGANCTEVLVWHTQTKNKKVSVVRINKQYLDDSTNLGALFRSLSAMGVATASDTEGPVALISKNGKTKPHSQFPF